MNSDRAEAPNFRRSGQLDIVKAMSVFVAIVENGSFTSAARMLLVSTTSVSRSLLELEKHLGVQLMHRTTRAVMLTECGETYYRFCLNFLAELKEVEALLADDGLSANGTIRVHVDKAIGIGSVLAHIADFSCRHPEARLEFGFNGNYQDSFRSGFDCAIAVGELEPSSFRAARVCDLKSVVVASPGYLGQIAAPQKPGDLRGMRIVELSGALVNGNVNWRFEHGFEHEEVAARCWMSVDDPEALLQAARYGAGVARLSRQAAAADLAAGTLCALLPAYRLPAVPVWVMYRYERFQPKCVCLFIEWLREWLAENGEYDAPAAGYFAQRGPPESVAESLATAGPDFREQAFRPDAAATQP